jgi:hypothetical protein
MVTLTYNPEKSIIIKDAIILNLMHNTFNLRDTDVTILFLLERGDIRFSFISGYITLFN